MADKSQVEELFGSDSEEEPDAASSGAAASSAAAPTGFEPDEETGDDANDVDEADLFGSDNDDEGGDGGAAPRRSTQDQPSAPPLNYELPILPKPNPDAELMVMRTPNILSINPRPFVMEEFEDEHEEGKQAQTDNVVRWRENPETGAAESNARVVTWSDGSMTLHVGDEVLSATTHTLDGGDQLFARMKGSNLECHGVLRRKMGLQPLSTGSSTHHKLTQAIAKQYVGKQRSVKMMSTTENPERKKLEDEKLWVEKDRMLMRQTARGSQDEYGGGGGDRGTAFDAAFLDDDDDVGEGNLGAIKARFKSGGGKKKAGGGGAASKAGGRPGGRSAFGGKRPRSGLASARRREEDGDTDDDDDDEEEGEEEDTGEMRDFIVGDEAAAEESDEEDEAEESGGDSDDSEEEAKPKKKKGRK